MALFKRLFGNRDETLAQETPAVAKPSIVVAPPIPKPVPLPVIPGVPTGEAFDQWLNDWWRVRDERNRSLRSIAGYGPDYKALVKQRDQELAVIDQKIIDGIRAFKGHPKALLQMLHTPLQRAFDSQTALERFVFATTYHHPETDYFHYLFEILAEEPVLLKEALFGGDSDDSLWSALLHHPYFHRELFKFLSETLEKRPDLMKEILQTDLRQTRGRNLNAALQDEHDWKSLGPFVYSILRVLKHEPEFLCEVLTNRWQSNYQSSESVIDSLAFWQPVDGFRQAVEALKPYPDLISKLIASTRQIVNMAHYHNAKGVQDTVDGLRDYPDLLKELFKDRNPKRTFISEALYAIQELPSARNVESLVALIHAAQGYVSFPVEAGPWLLLGKQLRGEGIDPQEAMKALTQCLKQDGKALRHIPRPSNFKEYIAFIQVMEKLNTLAATLDPAHLKEKRADGSLYVSPLLPTVVAHTPGNWVTMAESFKECSEHAIGDVKDLVREFVTYTALPSLLPMMEEGKRVANLNHDTIVTMIDAAVPRAARLLFSDKSLPTILAFSKRWHERRAAVLSEIREFARKGAWHPLLTDKEIIIDSGPAKGWHIVNITDSMGLDEEGQRMMHCVAGYADRCLSKNMETHSDILSFRDAHGGPQTTLELMRSPAKKGEGSIQVPKGPRLIINQHKAVHDKSPQGAQLAALEWLKTHIENGQVRVSPDRMGNSSRILEAHGEAMADTVGFYPTNERLEKAWKAFAQRDDSVFRLSASSHLVPNPYRDCDLQAFLEQSQLLEPMLEVLRNKQIFLEHSSTQMPLSALANREGVGHAR